MKQIFTFILLCFGFGAVAQTTSRTQSAITPGNIVVLRIGDGVSALSSAAFPVFLEERTTGGTLVQTIALPTAINGANYALTLSGSGTSEGALTMSSNGSYITLGGYNAAPGTAAIAGTNTATVLRSIALVDMAGGINTATALDAFSAGNIRSVVTVDGTAFWAAGSISGIRYITAGAATNSHTQLSVSPTNNRVVNIFNNQLYCSAASGFFQSIYSIGTGLPTTSGQTSTSLPGMPVVAGPSPYAYSMNAAGTVAYVADDRAIASGGGVQKWTFSAGTWSLAYTLSTGLTAGCRGLAVDWIGSNPVITVTNTPTSANSLFMATDAGASSAFTNIATAGTNTVYRGVVMIPLTPIWTGATSTNWSTASNWNINAVPSTNASVIIPSGTTNAPTNNGLVTVTDLTIAAGVTLTNNGLLNVKGNLANNGSITGTTNINGTLAQAISGIGTVLNMTINNAAGASIASGSSKLNVTNTLTLTAGLLTTNDNLVLKSSNSLTGKIATITGGSIAGKVTQERFVPGKGSRSWSLLASPFNQTISSSWQQQVYITGAGTGGSVCPSLSSNSNGFDATLTNAPSMYIYDGSKTVGSRWTSVSGTGISLQAGTGYRMNIRGPKSTGCTLLDGSVTTTDDVVLSSTGALSAANKNLGSFTTSLLNNGVTGGSNDNYLFAGNPYPSPISFSALQTGNNTGTGITTNYAIFAPGNTVGNYAFWNGLTFTGGNTGLSDANGDIIANGQGFFVQAQTAGAGVTLNWDEGMKSASSFNGYFRELNGNRLRIGYLLANGSKADEIMVQFADKGTVTELNNEDVPSMNSGTQYLKSLKAGTGLAFNTRNSSFSQDTVHLQVVSSTTGQFKLSFYDFDQLVQHTQANIYLLDSYTGSAQLMNNNKEYPFTVDMAIAATQGNNRFAVVFSKPITINPSIASSIRAYPNPVVDQLTIELPTLAIGSYNIRLLDIAGKLLTEQKAKATTILGMGRLTSGSYILEVTNGKGEKQVQKIIKD
jgi:hypothetical protein